MFESAIVLLSYLSRFNTSAVLSLKISASLTERFFSARETASTDFLHISSSRSISKISSKTTRYLSNTSRGFSAIISFESSTAILSAEMFFKSFLQEKIALDVSSSISNPSTAENLSALIMRSASSPNRISGSPTQRIVFLLRSALPPKRSKIPVSGLYAKAFMVKSRLFKSSSILPENVTF